MFDTALMRLLARPEDVHLLTGLRAHRQGLLRCSAEAYQDYRQEAERAARQAAAQAGHDEPRLEEIHRRLFLGAVITSVDDLCRVECEAEASVCRPIVPVRQALSDIGLGRQLVFLSDSVLPGPAVAAMLTAGGFGPAPTVITSADIRRSKASGRLFTHVLENLGTRASDILHIGDNPDSDIRQAKAHGLATFHLPRAWPPPEPEKLRRQHPILRLVHSHRRSRPMSPSADASPPIPRYASVLMIGFTLFVLAEARRRGIGRVYFLARDGYIPFAIARRLAAHRVDSPQLDYLHVSRQAVLVPALSGDLPALATVIADSMLDRPARTILSFLGFNEAETSRLLSEIGVDPHDILDRATAPASIHRLLRAGGAMIADRLNERRDAAMAYLRQSGFLAPGPRLLVDVGWRGSTQKALARLTESGPGDIVGCYIGLVADALGPEMNLGNAAGYLFSFGHPRDRAETVRDGYGLLELFLSAPHGSVSHYTTAGEVAVPVLANEAEPGGLVRRQAVEAIEAGCLAEFDSLDRMLGGDWPEELAAESALFDTADLLSRPSRAEVAAMNAVPFIHGIGGTGAVVAVNPVPWDEMLRNPRGALGRIATSPWRAGAARASLPWPIPDMHYADFRHRMERLLRLIGR